MAAPRFPRAKTATNLAVTIAVGVLVTAAGSATLAAADRGRGPGDGNRRAAARLTGAAQLPARAPLPSARTPASERSVARAPAVVSNVIGPVSPAARAVRDRGPRHLSAPTVDSGHGEAPSPYGTLRGRPQARVPTAHAGPLARREPERTSQEASRASEPAAATLPGLSTAEGLRNRGRAGGGRGAHGHGSGGGSRGKHHSSGGEAPTPGGARTVSTVKNALPAAVAAPRPAASVSAASVSAATVSAASVSAATAPAAPQPLRTVALVPQIAAIAPQPTSGHARRAAAHHAREAPAGGFQAALVGAPAAAGEPLAAAETGTATISRAAKRSPARTHGSSNPLEGIGRHIPLPIPVPDWSKPIIIALLILAVWFGIRASLAGARARRLERQRAGLLRDMGAMQAALVPLLPRRLGGLDVSVAYRPAEGPAAGGDFYDVFAPRPGVVAIMLGDVSGHGHEALQHAALTRYTLRAYLQAGLEPRMALALAGRVLVDPTGGRYATVAVGVYEAAKGTLTYALAGHPPPMLLGLPGVEPVTACSSPPVGWGLPTGRRQTTISLPADTEACFFSDGLIEARREGQLLGREHLREILAALGPGAVAEDLLSEVRAAAQGAPDDMVACVLSPQATASAERVHVEELEVDAGTLSRAGVRRFLRQCRVAPAAIEAALLSAAATVGAAGTATLHVELTPQGSSVEVRAPRDARARSAARADGGEAPPLRAPGDAGDSLRARALA
jgi:hypothetical protein